MLPKYKVLTRKSILDMEYINEKQWEQDCLKLVEEQNSILKAKGIDILERQWVHFFESPYSYDIITKADIDDAIQHLAIKDGYDLVKYENGNYGYVAYYNCVDNGFEIIGV